MTFKLPKTGTKSRKLLEFVARHNGVRFSQMQQFICEISGLDWEKRETITVGIFSGKTCKNEYKKRTVRAYRGYWCTNLCSGSTSICEKFLQRKNGLWFLNDRTTAAFAQIQQTIKKSSLELVSADDSIMGSSDTCTTPPPSKVVGDYIGRAASNTVGAGGPTFNATPQTEIAKSSDELLIQQLRSAQADVERTKKAVASVTAEYQKSLQALIAIEKQARVLLGL